VQATCLPQGRITRCALTSPILASAVTRRQTFEEYIAVLYAAIRKHGCPEGLVSDHGGVFRDHRAMHIYRALGIEKLEIEKRQSWQNYLETALYVIWNLSARENCQITCIMWTWDDQREEQFHIIENKVSA